MDRQVDDDDDDDGAEYHTKDEPANTIMLMNYDLSRFTFTCIQDFSFDKKSTRNKMFLDSRSKLRQTRFYLFLKCQRR